MPDMSVAPNKAGSKLSPVEICAQWASWITEFHVGSSAVIPAGAECMDQKTLPNQARGGDEGTDRGGTGVHPTEGVAAAASSERVKFQGPEAGSGIAGA